jgi:hypothetical protein
VTSLLSDIVWSSHILLSDFYKLKQIKLM